MCFSVAESHSVVWQCYKTKSCSDLLSYLSPKALAEHIQLSINDKAAES